MRVSTLTTILVSALAAPAAHAQGTVTQAVLSTATAKLVAEAALEACVSQGFHTTVAVIDRAGNLLVVLRDEQAHPVTVEMAQRKAQTAVIFRTSTLEFQALTASDPTRMPQRDVSGILALGGGVPIRVDGEIIGGVASSGSSQTDDDACARAGAARAEELLKSGSSG